MILRSCLLTGWLGCMAGALAVAQEPVPILRSTPQPLNRVAVETSTIPTVIATSSADAINQRTADNIAAALGRQAKLQGYHIDISVVDGVAELRGNVSDASQRSLATEVAAAVEGVTQISNQLNVGKAEPKSGIVPAQDQVPVLPKDTPPALGQPGTPFPPVPGLVTPPPMGPGYVAPPAAAMPFGPIPNSPYPAPAPMLANHPGMMPNPQYQPPPLPPYAWPTYAPYNNFSRVATPTTFAYNQWPFIGPMYPYPKIPLGWRRITLEWQDGSWWYGRESNSHDWWRIRYW